MEWGKMTTEDLLKELRKGYPEIEFKIVEEPFNTIVGKVNKDIEVNFHIGETDHDIWKSNQIVHCGVTQKKGQLQGYGGAVDNFDSLNTQVAYCISKGKEWAGFKEIKKKLF